jgi:release factor glutamine methyltransferase
MKQPKRCKTAYEKNQLLKHRIPSDKWEIADEMPVEYITGFGEFCGRDFIVTPKVLIPRVESEGIIELAEGFIGWLVHNGKQTLTIADVGTGSGNIGLSVYLNSVFKRNIDRVILSEIDAAALDVAQRNLEKWLTKQEERNKFQLLNSNLLSSFPSQKIELFLANLPYIPSGLLVILDKSVKYYEPELALDGGEDGLNIVREFLHQAAQFLTKQGLIIIEVDSRLEITRETLALTGSSWNFLVVADEFKRQRYVVIGEHSLKILKDIVLSTSLRYNHF